MAANMTVASLILPAFERTSSTCRPPLEFSPFSKGTKQLSLWDRLMFIVGSSSRGDEQISLLILTCVGLSEVGHHIVWLPNLFQSIDAPVGGSAVWRPLFSFGFRFSRDLPF